MATKCECTARQNGWGDFEITFCPLHAAAEDMYEALEELILALRHGKSQLRGRIMAAQALAKAEGGN